MKNEPYLVISKIEVIEKTDTLIHKLREIKDDSMRNGTQEKVLNRRTFIRND